MSSREGVRGHFALYKGVNFFPATCIRQRGRTDGRTDGRTAIFVAAAAAAGARRTGPRPRRRRPQKLKNKSPPDGRPSKKNWLRTAGRTKKKRKNQSVSQTIDQVMAINSVQKSSKSELSSGGKRLFKVSFKLTIMKMGRKNGMLKKLHR